MADDWWEQQYGQYFTGMSTLGGNIKASPLYGNQQFKDMFFHFGSLGEALRLSVTRDYLVPALQAATHDHDIVVMGFELARQFYIQFAIVGAGAAIGAVIGGTAGTVTIPLAGTIAGAGSGAVLGAGIASWLLFGIGLSELAGEGPYIVSAAGDELERGVQIAMKGDSAAGAKEFAGFWAQIFVVIIPMLIIALFIKGRGLVGSLLRNETSLAGSMFRYLQSRLYTSGMFREAGAILGLTEEELEAFAGFSRGKILVARGCNPRRLDYVHAGYHAKPVAVHAPWNSAKSGPYIGQVVCDVSRSGEVLEGYELEAVNGHPGRYQLIPRRTYAATAAPRQSGQPGGYPSTHYNVTSSRDYNALLEGHFVEEFQDGGDHKYRLLHRDGLPYVSDIDRVMYAEFNRDGTLHVGTHWPNSDPRELAWMNDEIRRRLQNPVSFNVFQHGHAGEWMIRDERGRMIPGWPHRDPATGRWNFDLEEPLLVAVNGNIYILDWQQFAAFGAAFERVGVLFPWQ